MNKDIYCPYNLYYYRDKPIKIRIINNMSDEYRVIHILKINIYY